MDLPQPPQDTDLRNIIDKLAQFVARNGPEFEQMTKSKQKGNPKFQFLYGGEFYNYYQYKVSAEQAVLRQQGLNNSQATMNSQQIWNQTQSTNPLQISTSNASLEQLTQQQETLKEQIRQSEQNLTAQHTVLLQQQQVQVETAVLKYEAESLKTEAEECGIDLNEFEKILQPIIDNCTKDSISNGKSWILSHTVTEQQSSCIAHCLLLKIINGAVPFPQKLHIIYLVNDVLHHCARKHADELKKNLEHVVVPMFCNANVGATEEQKSKLDKLLKLWESKANYLATTTVKKLRQPASSYQQYQAELVAKYANEVSSLTQQTKATFEGYQAQHQAFVSHAMQQIITLQQQKQNVENQNNAHVSPNLGQHDSISAVTSASSNLNQNLIQQSQNLLPLNLPPPTNNISPSNIQENFLPPIDPTVPPPNLSQPLNMNQSSNGLEHQIPFTQPPPGFLPGGFPDFSKPPPGFPVAHKPEIMEDLLPTVPYYDLPAGLMIPLIRLEDTNYKPLNPKAIRLPPPAPPSERLLAAVEAFYAIPSHERPRDSEGWEKLGLYEYYKAKNNAKKFKEEQIRLGLRQKSRSPSPVIIPTLKSPSPPKRRYQSKSPSPQTYGGSTRLSRSRSPSRSPPRRRHSKSKKHRSDSRSQSKSPPPFRENIRRSPTPPSFVTPFVKPDVQELDESNRGHQLLKKMGWGGSGLGAKEQGIVAPISGGDVRDHQDQFKGVGMNLNDPYENFRKHKGAAFITRMKARAEERAQESKNYKVSQATPD